MKTARIDPLGSGGNLHTAILSQRGDLAIGDQDGGPFENLAIADMHSRRGNRQVSRVQDRAQQ